MVSLQINESERRIVGKLSGGAFLLATLVSATVMAEKHESFAMPFHISVVHGDTIINGKPDNANLCIDKGISSKFIARTRRYNSVCLGSARYHRGTRSGKHSCWRGLGDADWPRHRI